LKAVHDGKFSKIIQSIKWSTSLQMCVKMQKCACAMKCECVIEDCLITPLTFHHDIGQNADKKKCEMK